MTAPPQGVEVSEIEYPAGKVRYYRAGTSGPAIVLLHGGGLDNALLSWRHTIPVLAADHRVFIPDLPGQGGSVPWLGRANQRTLEETTRWLFDSWELSEAIIVGLSMGASIATGFALRHPQRVNGLVLVDPGGMQHKLHNHLLNWMLVKSRFLGRIAAKGLAHSRRLARSMLTNNLFANEQPVSDLDSLVTELVAAARDTRTVFTDWQCDSIGRKSMEVNHLPNLFRIRCPTTVIHGEQDKAIPLPVARDVVGAIPGASLRIVSGAGHWPNREKPTEFNALLREFVNQQY